MCLAEYIWLGGYGQVHSKCRTIKQIDSFKCEDFAMWNCDGSSTKQIMSKDSELTLLPQKIYRDPFRKDGYLVLCDTWYFNCIAPHETNERFYCYQTMSKIEKSEQWMSFRIEYYMLDPKSELPLGFRSQNDQITDKYFGNNYMVGSRHIYKRQMVDEFFKYCLYAGIKVISVLRPSLCIKS